MRFSTKAITTCAVLAALALALSYLESFFPPLLPLPGVKLGLANIVTVYALYASARRARSPSSWCAVCSARSLRAMPRRSFSLCSGDSPPCW